MGFNEIAVVYVQFGIAWGLQKLGLILEDKNFKIRVRKKIFFYKKWFPKLIFLD